MIARAGANYELPGSSFGTASGTSFPGSPSDGDLFYRTDTRILYEYDLSSLQWLSVDRKYVSMGPGDVIDATTTAAIVRAVPVFEKVYIESWQTNSFVSTTNTGSAYWTLTLRKFDTGASTTSNIGTFSTNADAASAATTHSVTIGVTVDPASNNRVDAISTKTGAPGALRCPMILVVRSVG